MGGAKAGAVLDGRSLLDRALAALESVCARRAVVAKADTPLPGLPEGVERWTDAGDDHHPRHGLIEAVRRTNGVVLVLAVDLPLVPSSLLAELAEAVERGAAAAVARADGPIQPLCAAYDPAVLGALEAAPRDEPLIRSVGRLDPVIVDTGPRFLHNVNTPGDLEEASALLRAG